MKSIFLLTVLCISINEKAGNVSVLTNALPIVSKVKCESIQAELNAIKNECTHKFEVKCEEKDIIK